MKNICFILCALLVLTMFASCKISSGTVGIESEEYMSNTNNDESWTPPVDNPDVPKEELSREENDYIAFIKSLKSENIKEIRISYSLPNITYFSSDLTIIEGWIKLLNKMEFEALPYVDAGGGGYGLYFTDLTDADICIGGFMTQRIYISSQRVIISIKNYDDLRNEFDRLIAEMEKGSNRKTF